MGKGKVTVTPMDRPGATCQRVSDRRQNPCRIDARFRIETTGKDGEEYEFEVCRTHVMEVLGVHLRLAEGT